MSSIEISQLSLTYNHGKKAFQALTDINLSIASGEFVCVLGPSGCGKSSLLSILEGLQKPSTGEVKIDGRLIRGTGTDRGVVFQHYSLFPWLTAKKNVLFGIRQSRKHLKKSAMTELAEKYLTLVGLENALEKYPAELSGGMQQRVAIARALAMNPEVLLMDEPFGAIDAKNRVTLQELVSRLAKTENKTVIFVTHDIDEALLLADRIVFMAPGRIKDEIPVAWPRPRLRDEISGTAAYNQLRKYVFSLFYENVSAHIGGSEVYL